MLKRNLYLALAALVVAPASASAHDNFVSRAFSAPDGAGRWVNRRLTIRHHDQDAPFAAKAVRKEDTFLSRMFTERDDRGRWLNRRLTIRHEGQDAPKRAKIG